MLAWLVELALSLNPGTLCGYKGLEACKSALVHANLLHQCLPSADEPKLVLPSDLKLLLTVQPLLYYHSL